ncbi:hypothetical protein PsorP6_014295 [Peronosclerospora sorghi]|uniref:Uncharacterized protein n=1 Tax=Peronosclerospora sorghi TaxID=230839 RepID=A0ACC0VFT5_9STRA|nr:hypothetical protein PsorP6_014295 [Peronosclerospora sorghi]
MATTATSPDAAPSPRDMADPNDDALFPLAPMSSGDSKVAPGSRGAATIDIAAHRFPFCLVWSPIPILTWVFPFIGHLGIADSHGVIFDFAGPYTIGRNQFAFGAPTRYVQCHVRPEDAAKWDNAVAAGCHIYEKRLHNLCWDNCHSHVAVCLEQMHYGGRKRWNMVQLCVWMFVRGKYVNVGGLIKTWLPFVLVVALSAMVRSSA